MPTNQDQRGKKQKTAMRIDALICNTKKNREKMKKRKKRPVKKWGYFPAIANEVYILLCITIFIDVSCSDTSTMSNEIDIG
jgi:hypothetical protein